MSRRHLKTALSSVTGAGAVFLSVMAQDTQGASLVWLASGAGLLGGVSAVSGYFVHRTRSAPSPARAADEDPLYVPPSNLPSSSRYFTGRKDELWAISAALKPQERNGGIRVAVVHGLGGIGKTQLAATFAENRLESGPSLVWWLASSSYERLRSELLELAACLGIPEHASQAVVLNRLWGRLRDTRGWLLVYDDVQDDSLGPLHDDPEDPRPSLLPRAGQGEVLITTQRREGWDELRARTTVIELHDLGADDGLAFLRARTGATHHDDEALRELGTRLHWLPLSLEQAGAYIAQAEISVREYLHRLPEDPAGRAAATFRLAIERVTAVEEVAEDLMRLCCFLASEDVRQDMLMSNPDMIPSPLREVIQDRAALNRVARRLSNYSLLRRSGDKESGTVAYGMHPQVQRFVRQRMDEEARLVWSQAAVRLLETAFPEMPQQLRQRTVCEELMPHVEAVMDELVWAASEDGDGVYGAALDPYALARLLHRVGEYQEHRCDWAGALDLFEREATLRELYGRDADDLGRTTALLAVARQRYLLADLDAAEEGCRRALEECRGHRDDPAFLPLQAQCLRQLGGILREQISFDAALGAVTRAIVIYEGPGADWEGLDRAVAEQEAGMIHRNAGQLTQALERYARAEDRIPQNGSEEPREHTVFRAMLRRDVGIVAQDRGDLDTAELQLDEALTVFRTLRGPDDFETSQVAKFLADVRRRQGEELRERARASRRPLRRSRLNRQARAKLDSAQALLTPVVELHRKRRDTERHKYAACLNKLGSLQHAQGRTAEALQTLQEAEKIYADKYGADHHYRAKTLSRLGAVLITTGTTLALSTDDQVDAERALRLAEGIFRTRLGENHPSLVAVYERLALCTADENQAAEHRARARRIKAALDGESPPSPSQTPEPLPAPS
ncbi:tetratricopeptide repeat protein [Streptomyces sp. 4N124]|uniref:tetratricopeptide repeat protein n=1 Tax=Streptomyces sp. 4N124 TaxID=3457420 RepID=UPI003FD3E7FA